MNDLVISLLAVVGFNLLMFPIAFKLQTDKLTDITYSASFVFLAIFGMWRGQALDAQAKMLTGILVILWGLRLGVYLFWRVNKLGRDARFDEIRTNGSRFFRFFLIQGVSAWIISVPFLLLFYNDHVLSPIPFVIWIGWIIALIGLIIETIADNQKSTFKAIPGNADTLLTSGLYKHVRYPNYLGEILFWIGIFTSSAFVFQGLDWLAILSPIVIILLLTKLSGIPILEKSRAKKYAGQQWYIDYVSKTNLLFPGY